VCVARLLLFGLLFCSLVLPGSAQAHAGQPPAPHDIWSAWTWDPLVIFGLAVTGGLYGRGVYVLWQRPTGHALIPFWRVLVFGVGWLALFVALVSPLDALGEALFSAHMVQHMVLILIAAPLLVLGAPLLPVLWGLPGTWRRQTGLRLGDWQRQFRSSWRVLSHPLAAWCLHTIALWVWHAPVLYEAAIRHRWVHVLEHASFLGTALLFWWTILPTEHGAAWRREPVGVLSIFATAMQSGALGALITFSRTPWYAIYAQTTAWWGLTPLEDQQLAGLIMWIPGGTLYMLAAAGLLATWLQEPAHERQQA
jgi:putative membrane protein